MDDLVTIKNETKPMTLAEVKAQVNLIQQIMQSVMKEGHHYGKVPGCGDKKVLLKPGAEKIMMTFRLAAEPQIEEIRTADEIIFKVAVKITNQATGMFLGTGVGECSTSEEKYKWRAAVSDDEWDSTPEDRKRIKYASKWEGGSKKSYTVNQVKTNPSDLANTVKKMAKKRALVDGTLTVTAASDIFTQDLDESFDETSNQNGSDKKPQKRDTVKPAQTTSSPNQNPKSAKSKLKDELLNYCEGDMDKVKEALKAVSIFGEKGNEKFITDIDHVNVSERWCFTALGNLRKRVKEEKSKPDEILKEGCTKNPDSCNHSSWVGEKIHCGSNDICKFKSSYKK